MTPKQLLALWDHAVWVQKTYSSVYRSHMLAMQLEKHGLCSPRLVAYGF